MVLEPDGFDAVIMGDGPDRSYQARVYASFRNAAGNYTLNVEVAVYVRADADSTLVALKQQAIDMAVPVLEAAVALLKSRPLAEAKEEQWSREDAARRPT